MAIDLNQVIRDIAGGFDTAKRLELEMREELLKQQQEQQHQLDCDEEVSPQDCAMSRELNFND